MHQKMKSLQTKLERLAELDVSLDLLGAEAHEYELEPPLTHDELREAEAQFRVQLPDDYRAFLVGVAAGGAGPGEGLVPLVKSGQLWEWDGGDEDDLSRPFRFAAPWNLADAPEWSAPPPEDSQAYDDWNERFEDAYFDPTLTDGAIELGEDGSAGRFLLVVTGPERGNIWRDGRSNRAGLEPLAGPTGERISFVQWYERWLDEALARFD